MKLKWVFCIILLILPVLKIQSNVQAANTSQIEIVLNKKVLDEEDKKIIDDYIREVIDVMLNEMDLANIARYRDAILARKGSQPQYVLQFNESIGKYLTEAFDKAKNINPPKRQSAIIANLLILIDGLEDVQFALLPMNKVEDKNVIVSYWAVQQ